MLELLRSLNKIDIVTIGVDVNDMYFASFHDAWITRDCFIISPVGRERTYTQH